MDNSPRECSKIQTPFSLEKYREWGVDGELRQLSNRTISQRQKLRDKLFWFLGREGFQTIGVAQLRQFFHHLNNGHTEPGGRFDNPRLTEPLRPVSLRT